MVGKLKLRVRKWSRLQIDWTSSSTEDSGDGMATLAGGKKGKIKPANQALGLNLPFVVKQQRLGQVERDDPATVGTLFLDDFASWAGK